MTKQEAIKACKPPSDDWEQYADRLWELSIEYGRSTALDEVLDIIDTAQTYKMFEGQEDTYLDKMVLKEAVEALRGGEQV